MNPIADLATVLALLVLFAVVELLRHRGATAETTRRLTHVACGGVAAIFPLYLELADVIVLGAISTIVLVWTSVRGSLLSVHGVARPTIGALVFPVGGVLAALVVWDRPAALAYGMLVLALADPAAGVTGKLVGGLGWRVFGGRKTVAGSLAFFGVAALLGIVFALPTGSVPVVAVLTVALLLTLIEGSLGYGLDNLLLPLLAGLLGAAYLGL